MQKFNNIQYYNFFDDLKSSTNKDFLVGLFQKYELERKDKKLYPDIKFNITVNEIEILKQNGYITEDYFFDSGLSKRKELSSLEKLLYSIIWKQGDLKKEKHIISGICGKNTVRKVFNQFGKYLNDKNEPIIDQHVVRAYIYFKEKIIIDDIKDKHIKIYSDECIKWIKNYDLFKIDKNLLDELLFSFGKKIKNKD